MSTLYLSASITNLDASPVVQNTTGVGAVSYSKRIFDFLTLPINNSASGPICKFVRIPVWALVKSVKFESAAQTAGSWDIGLYYSDSTTDGTLAALQGTALSTSLFASAVSTNSAVGITDETNQSGHYTASKRNIPIGYAAGIPTASMAGFVDVCLTAVATSTATALAGLEVGFDL